MIDSTLVTIWDSLTRLGYMGIMVSCGPISLNHIQLWLFRRPSSLSDSGFWLIVGAAGELR